MSTRQVPGEKAGLRPGWKAALGQGLGPEQWVQLQGQAWLQHSRGLMEGV